MADSQFESQNKFRGRAGLDPQRDPSDKSRIEVKYAENEAFLRSLRLGQDLLQLVPKVVEVSGQSTCNRTDPRPK